MKSGPLRIAAWACAAAVLLAVFAMYLQPEMVITLANQLWSCFG
jgi:hypothetical protein